MPRTVNFDTGSDLDDFVKGSDESDSEPELSESEAEDQSSSEDEEEANHGARGVTCGTSVGVTLCQPNAWHAPRGVRREARGVARPAGCMA